jgi:predicted RNase H-like HicB family nuclease
MGETPEQALQEVLQAKEAWIASAKASNKPIPSARFKPVHYQV